MRVGWCGMGWGLGGSEFCRALPSAQGILRRAAPAQDDMSRSPTLPPKQPPQSIQRAFYLLSILGDLGRPAAELVVRDCGRLVEVLAVEEEFAHHAAEEAAGAFM